MLYLNCKEKNNNNNNRTTTSIYVQITVISIHKVKPTLNNDLYTCKLLSCQLKTRNILLQQKKERKKREQYLLYWSTN